MSQNASAQQQQVYRVYVEPLPDYATSYASNVIYDATNAWTAVNPNIKFYQAQGPSQADLYVQWVKDFGSVSGKIGEEINGQTIFVGLGGSNCNGSWQPYSSGTVTQIAEQEIGHFLGLGHSSNPNDIMYPTTNVQYGTITWQKNLDTGYVWFIPICTTKSVTSISYSISLSRQDDAFDVYVVPSQSEYNNYVNNQQFQYYQGNGCYGTNRVSYNGVCEGIAQNSGLLVATRGHILINHLVTVTAQLTEQNIVSPTNIPVLSQPSGSSLPQVTNQSPPSGNNSPNYSWVIGSIIIVVLLGGGFAAMRYAIKR